jgi:hypothetical protein
MARTWDHKKKTNLLIPNSYYLTITYRIFLFLVNPLRRLYMTVLKSNPITIVIFGYLAYKSCRFLIKGYFSQGVRYAYYRASALSPSLSLSLSLSHTHTHPLIHPQSANHPWNIPAYLDINGSTKSCLRNAILF